MNELICDKLYDRYPIQDDFFDDFTELDVVGRWTDTSADAGCAPALLADGTSSSVNLVTAATLNFECLLGSNASWDITSGRPLLFESRFKHTENTTFPNIYVGHCSVGKTADQMLDNAGGVAASFSGFGLYKVAGGTYYKFVSSVAATRYGDNTTKSAVQANSWIGFRVEVRPISSTEAEIAPLIDLNGGDDYHQMRDYTTNQLIKHILTYTSYATAFVTLNVKAGGANAETLTVDWVRTSQRR